MSTQRKLKPGDKVKLNIDRSPHSLIMSVQGYTMVDAERMPNGLVKSINYPDSQIGVFVTWWCEQKNNFNYNLFHEDSLVLIED